MRKDNVIIFGAGGNGAAHLQMLRPHVGVAGFADNAPQKRGTRFCGHPVYGAEDLAALDYDRIFIASSWALDIYAQLSKSRDTLRGEVVDYTLRILADILAADAEDRGDPMLITGNSYAFNAFFPGCFDRPLLNLSMSSQDIRTDYELLRYSVGRLPGKKPPYVLICLYHYIFDYEYAKRECLDGATVYSFLSVPDAGAEAYSATFLPGLSEQIRNGYTQTIAPAAIRSAPASARSRSDKAYPASRERNVRILEDMTRFAMENGIRPVFVTTPMHASYVSGITDESGGFFQSTVRDVAAKYGVAVFDGLRMELPERAFGDPTHLNRYGSCLFSTAVAEFLGTLRGGHANGPSA